MTITHMYVTNNNIQLQKWKQIVIKSGNKNVLPLFMILVAVPTAQYRLQLINQIP